MSQVRVGEVVDEHAGIRVDLLEKRDACSPAASPLSQLGRSRIGLCSPKTSFVARSGLASAVEDAQSR